MSDTDVAAWSALLRVHATLVPALDRELQNTCDLPLTWYDVLQELSNAPGHRLSMGELGHKAVVSRTRVSRVVEALGAAGLVTREGNPDDRRSAYATMTEAGHERFRAAAPVYTAGIRRHFTGLMTEDEVRTMAVVLEKVLAQNQ